MRPRNGAALATGWPARHPLSASTRRPTAPTNDTSTGLVTGADAGVLRLFGPSEGSGGRGIATLTDAVRGWRY
jgi:hypothetical protein